LHIFYKKAASDIVEKYICTRIVARPIGKVWEFDLLWRVVALIDDCVEFECRFHLHIAVSVSLVMRKMNENYEGSTDRLNNELHNGVKSN